MSPGPALPIARRVETIASARGCARRIALRALVIGCLLGTGTAVTAVELIVVDQAGCVYCARFDAEIAGVWPKTEEGRRAPLRRVDLHGHWPADLAAIDRPDVTPTFVLLDDGGAEVDRLTGYPGDEHFWFLIGRMLDGLGSP